MLAALAGPFDASPEVTPVSCHIAPTPGEAEDGVQQTFVTTIERADRRDESRAMLPWLPGVLVRQARTDARAALRRVRPERLMQFGP